MVGVCGFLQSHHWWYIFLAQGADGVLTDLHHMIYHIDYFLINRNNFLDARDKRSADIGLDDGGLCPTECRVRHITHGQRA